MTLHTQLGYQLLGNPPDSFKSKVGGGKIIKIVGDEADLANLRNWVGKVEVLEGRLITIEPRIEAARDKNNLSDIPELAKEIAAIYAGVDQRIGVTGVWWEIPPIMPSVDAIVRADKVVSSWIGEWNATCAEEFAKLGLRSVCFGFATGYPQVAPYGSADKPDLWPLLYPALKRLNALGVHQTRIGVEEYVTGGQLVTGDNSNIGRGQHVFEKHLKPNGWLDLVFRVIEGGFDVPAMHDVQGMNPTFFWDTMLKVDEVYGILPYYDAVALYAVVDPVGSKEAAFAITPSNAPTKQQPDPSPSYLEIGQQYFKDNTPTLFVYSQPSTPAPQPVPAPTPVWKPITVVNPSFELGGAVDAPSDPMGLRRIPVGWQVGWTTGGSEPHVEIETHPSHVDSGASSARVYSNGAFRSWLWQIVPVPIGKTIRLTVRSLGTATNVVDAPSTPGEVVNRRIGLDKKGTIWPKSVLAPVDPSLIWSDPNTQMDMFTSQSIVVDATSDKMTILLDARHSGISRADAFWDNITLEYLDMPVANTPPILGAAKVGNNKIIDGPRRVRVHPTVNDYNIVDNYDTGKDVVVTEIVTAPDGGKWGKIIVSVPAYIRTDGLNGS